MDENTLPAAITGPKHHVHKQAHHHDLPRKPVPSTDPPRKPIPNASPLAILASAADRLNRAANGFAAGPSPSTAPTAPHSPPAQTMATTTTATAGRNTRSDAWSSGDGHASDASGGWRDRSSSLEVQRPIPAAAPSSSRRRAVRPSRLPSPPPSSDLGGLWESDAAEEAAAAATAPRDSSAEAEAVVDEEEPHGADGVEEVVDAGARTLERGRSKGKGERVKPRPPLKKASHKKHVIAGPPSPVPIEVLDPYAIDEDDIESIFRSVPLPESDKEDYDYNPKSGAGGRRKRNHSSHAAGGGSARGSSGHTGDSGERAGSRKRGSRSFSRGAKGGGDRISKSGDRSSGRSASADHVKRVKVTADEGRSESKSSIARVTVTAVVEGCFEQQHSARTVDDWGEGEIVGNFQNAGAAGAEDHLKAVSWELDDWMDRFEQGERQPDEARQRSQDGEDWFDIGQLLDPPAHETKDSVADLATPRIGGASPSNLGPETIDAKPSRPRTTDVSSRAPSKRNSASARSALFAAAASGDLAALAELLAAGTDPSARDAGGWTPLHDAAAGGHAAACAALLAAGADPAARTFAGDTPLHDAVLYARVDAVDVLVRAGANCGARNAWGEAPRDLVACSDAWSWPERVGGERERLVALLTRNGGLGVPVAAEETGNGEEGESEMAVVEGPALRRWTKMRVVESDEEDAGESDNKHVAAAESEQTVSGTECSKLAEEMVVEVGTEEGAGTIPKTEGTAVQGDPRPTLPTTLDSAQKSGGGMVDSLRPSLESAATCTKTSLVRPELTDSKDLLKNEKVGAPATAHGAPTKKRRQKLALGLSGHQVLADENHSQTARQSDGLQVSAILNDRNELVVGADAQRATAIAPASPDVRTAVPPNGHMTDEEMMHTTQALPERTSLGLPLYAITLEPDPFIVTRNDENVAQDTPLNKQQGPLQIGDKQRYFVDLQLALCFGLASGRDLLARLEPFSPTVSRVAPIRAREALQNSQVAVALLDAVLTRGARTVEAAAAHPQQQQQQQQHSCGQRTARFVRWVENADGRRALRMDAVDVLLLEVESVRRALAAAGVAEPDFGWTVPADGDVVDLVLDLARETTLAPEKKTPQDGGPSDVKAKYPALGTPTAAVAAREVPSTTVYVHKLKRMAAELR